MVDMKRDARIRAEIKELNDAVSVASNATSVLHVRRRKTSPLKRARLW